MKLGASQSIVQSDDAVNIHPSRAPVPHDGCRINEDRLLAPPQQGEGAPRGVKFWLWGGGTG